VSLHCLPNRHRRWTLWRLTALMATLVTSEARAAGPRLESVEPCGGQRGTSVTLTLKGDRLDRLREVLFLKPGLRAVKVAPEAAALARVEMEIDPACPLGEHAFLVRGDNGLTDWRTFWVGPYPDRLEAELNDRPESAQRIPLGTTIEGTLSEADQDLYAVDVPAGARISAEVVGMRLSRRLIDPHLTLLGPDGATLLEVDDTALLHQDPAFSFAAPKAGRYLIVVRDAAYGGGNDARYRLTVGAHAHPLAAYPAGGQPGQRLDLTLLGDALGARPMKVELPSGPDWVRAPFWLLHSGPESPTPLPLRIRPWPSRLEIEPNDRDDQAGEALGPPPFALNGVLGKPGDVDAWRVHLPAATAFEIQSFATRLGTGIDPVLTVKDSLGHVLVENDDGVRGDSQFRFAAPTDGDYLITVRDHLKRGHASAVYRVEVTPVERSLALAIPVENAVSQEGQTVLVSRGNRAALLVAARRDSFEGPISLDLDGLPAGVTARVSGPIEEGQYLTTLVLEADPKAPLGGGLVSLVGRCREPRGGGPEVTGVLSQAVGLAFGPPNNTVYHSLIVDRLPVAVVDELPFRLEVAQPRAPLVQDGRIDLRVRAVRAPGFTEAISLTLPFQPPWIEEPELAEVADGESEATFPLLAARAAAPRTWRLVVAAQTRIDGSKVQVVSAPLELRVVPPSCELAIEPARTQPGKNVEIGCRLTVKTPFEGKARARLLGLPKHASAPEVEVDAAATRIVFPVEVKRETPTAVHNTLYAELTTYQEGEPCRRPTFRNRVRGQQWGPRAGGWPVPHRRVQARRAALELPGIAPLLPRVSERKSRCLVFASGPRSSWVSALSRLRQALKVSARLRPSSSRRRTTSAWSS
jgi:hypothetical protein